MKRWIHASEDRDWNRYIGEHDAEKYGIDPEGWGKGPYMNLASTTKDDTIMEELFDEFGDDYYISLSFCKNPNVSPKMIEHILDVFDYQDLMMDYVLTRRDLSEQVYANIADKVVSSVKEDGYLNRFNASRLEELKKIIQQGLLSNSFEDDIDDALSYPDKNSMNNKNNSNRKDLRHFDLQRLVDMLESKGIDTSSSKYVLSTNLNSRPKIFRCNGDWIASFAVRFNAEPTIALFNDYFSYSDMVYYANYFPDIDSLILELIDGMDSESLRTQSLENISTNTVLYEDDQYDF